MGVFDKMKEHGHEQVVFNYDPVTGLKAIIAIHDTASGPARGGTRFKAYNTEDEALEDALRLSEAMTYKFIWAGLPRGGGKAVIMKDDETTSDRSMLFHTYGKFIDLLNGRFGTGEDLGTTPQDMTYIGEETRFVWGQPERSGGSGDPTIVTAYGVYLGLKVAVEKVFGSPDVSGRTVACKASAGSVPTWPNSCTKTVQN